MNEKLSNYVQFVVGGQLYEEDPEARNGSVRFVVLTDDPPNEAMLKVEGIKAIADPWARFPVAFYAQPEYLG